MYVGDLLLEMNKIDSRILYFCTSCSKLLVVLLKKFGLEKIEYVIPDGAYSCIYIDYLILKKNSKSKTSFQVLFLISSDMKLQLATQVIFANHLAFYTFFFSNTKHKIKSCCQFLHFKQRFLCTVIASIWYT